MIGTGSSAKQSIRSPGFGGKAVGHARGHLLGKQLGGSGSERKNLVTLFQNSVNSPIMRDYENAVRKAVEAGEIIEYSVTPIYDGNNLIPSFIHMKAVGNKGYKLDKKIPNKK